MDRKLFSMVPLLFPLAASAADLVEVSNCPGAKYDFVLTDYHAIPPFPDKWTVGEFHKACLDVPSMQGAQVCMAGKNGQLGAEKITYVLTYEIASQVRLTWNISGYQIGDSRSFTIQEADLAGDGSKDVVVAVLTGGSNGLGISYYSLYVITDDVKKFIGPIDAQDYGIVSGLYHDPSHQGCILLLSKWEGDTEPGRGGGLYAKGYWYTLEGDAIVGYSGLPSVERRFLNRFADERSNDSKSQPLLWFKDKTARPIKP